MDKKLIINSSLILKIILSIWQFFGWTLWAISMIPKMSQRKKNAQVGMIQKLTRFSEVGQNWDSLFKSYAFRIQNIFMILFI